MEEKNCGQSKEKEYSESVGESLNGSKSFKPGAQVSQHFQNLKKVFWERWNNCTMILCQALSVSLEKEMKNALIKVVSSFYAC